MWPLLQVQKCLAEHRAMVDDQDALDAIMVGNANQTEPVRRGLLPAFDAISLSRWFLQNWRPAVQCSHCQV